MQVNFRKTVRVETALLPGIMVAIPWHPDLPEPRIAWAGGEALAEQVRLDREYRWQAEPGRDLPSVWQRDSDGRNYQQVPELAIRQAAAALRNSAACPVSMPTLVGDAPGALSILNPLETICLLHAGVKAVPVAFCHSGLVGMPGLLSVPQPAQQWRYTIYEGDPVPESMTMAHPVAELLDYVNGRVGKFNLAQVDLEAARTSLSQHRPSGLQDKAPPVSLERQLQRAVREYDALKAAPGCQNALDLLNAAGVAHVPVRNVHDLTRMLEDLAAPVQASEPQRVNPTGSPLDLIGRHHSIAASLARRTRDRDPDAAMRDRLAGILGAVERAILADHDAAAMAKSWNVVIGSLGLPPGGTVQAKPLAM